MRRHQRNATTPQGVNKAFRSFPWNSALVFIRRARARSAADRLLAIVPAHTKPHPKRQLDWLKTEDAKSKDEGIRDVLVLPKGKELHRDKATNEPREPHLHIARSKNVGVLFCTILLLVVFITNVPLRGLWSVIVIGTIIFISIIFAILDWWDPILTYLSFLLG